MNPERFLPRMLRPRPPHLVLALEDRWAGALRAEVKGGRPASAVARMAGLPEGLVRFVPGGSPWEEPARVLEHLRPITHAVAASGGDAALVLPDRAFRSHLVHVEVLPKSRRDISAVLQFKVKRLLPYRVEEARLDWTVVRRLGEGADVLVVCMHESVALAAENLALALHWRPGLLAPAGLEWLLWAIQDGQEAVLAYLDGGDATIAYARSGELVFLRHRSVGAQPDEHGPGADGVLERELAATAVYMAEHLGVGDGVPVRLAGPGADAHPGHERRALVPAVAAWEETLRAPVWGRWP